MTLYPLCRHGRTPQDAVLHAADVIERTAAASEREDQLFLLSVFGGLAYPRLNVERIVESRMLRESKIVRKIWREAQVEARQEDLLEVLRSRFGDETAADLSGAVKALDDLELLKRLFHEALGGASLEEFRAALSASGVAG
jgi:hypothetical protein